MKVLMLILFFGVANLSYAKSTPPEIVFEYKTNVNYFERYVLTLKRKNEILINGIMLDAKELKAKNSEISFVQDLKASSGVLNCVKGEYRLHSLVKDKIEKSESGCLESSRYQELNRAFLSLIN